MAFPLPPRSETRIDLSPLIDVVFQLLIFFVVTTTFLSDTGLPLELPEAGSGQHQQTEEQLSVRVTADGAIHFHGRMVSLKDLSTLLQEAVQAAPDQAVTIYGDGSVDYETIVQVMDVARRVRAKGVVLATEEPAPPR
ncbi:MAG: ExbD/TolR family protein [Acidobacteriota bacterium]